MNPHDDDRFRTRLWELIGDLRFALLTSRCSDGSLHSRPLSPQNDPLQRGSTLLFFVPARSTVVAEVAADARVGVGYADLPTGRYVSIRGTARVRHDPPQQAALWNAMARAWFPGGAEDPQLRLLEVCIDAVEYWDMGSNQMVPLQPLAPVETDTADRQSELALR